MGINPVGGSEVVRFFARRWRVTIWKSPEIYLISAFKIRFQVCKMVYTTKDSDGTQSHKGNFSSLARFPILFSPNTELSCSGRAFGFGNHEYFHADGWKKPKPVHSERKKIRLVQRWSDQRRCHPYTATIPGLSKKKPALTWPCLGNKHNRDFSAIHN